MGKPNSISHSSSSCSESRRQNLGPELPFFNFQRRRRCHEYLKAAVATATTNAAKQMIAMINVRGVFSNGRTPSSMLKISMMIARGPRNT